MKRAKTSAGSVLFIRFSAPADKRKLDRAAARERLGTSAWARRVLILAAENHAAPTP